MMMRETKVRVALADSCLFSEHVVTGNPTYIFTDDGEIKDILEEAGVKSVSTLVQLCSFSVVDGIWLLMFQILWSLRKRCRKGSSKMATLMRTWTLNLNLNIKVLLTL